MQISFFNWVLMFALKFEAMVRFTFFCSSPELASIKKSETSRRTARSNWTWPVSSRGASILKINLATNKSLRGTCVVVSRTRTHRPALGTQCVISIGSRLSYTHHDSIRAGLPNIPPTCCRPVILVARNS